MGSRFARFMAGVLAVLLAGLELRATDIEGVQPAAVDQPRVNIVIRREPRAEPLAGKPPVDLLDLLEPRARPKKAYNIQAFLDTGASGILISTATADAMGIRRLEAINPATGRSEQVVFHDVGVGGSDQFHVGEPLFFAVAAFHPGTDTEEPDRHHRLLPAALRPQIGPIGGGVGLMQLVAGNLDVVGMPAMAGRVVVIDPKPTRTFDDTMRTYLYDPRTPYNPRQAKRDPGIPPVNRHVKLSLTSFARFTHITPERAQGPTLARNPFIGPDPAAAPGGRVDPTPPIVIAHNGRTSAGSWLLDTGAAASMISTKQAAALGISYVEGTMNTGSPQLRGVARDRQFTLTVGGIGGGRQSAGVYLDELRLPTRQGDTLVYKPAPVLVCDITVKDQQTGQQITLDGVFGMNFLTGSAQISGGLIPEIGKLVEGPYDWIVFDEPAGLLGLQLRQ